MPSPKDARKASAKKTPEKKVELGQSLARKRSQDFASKIQGWNQAGGGVAQPHEEAVVAEGVEVALEEEQDKQHKDKEPVQLIVESESPDADADPAFDFVSPPEEAAKDSVPGTPKTPDKVPPKTSGAKKTGRDVDLGRGAWVRRKSKPQVVETPEVKHAGTPKKRVISDGHWRRDRQAKEETPVKERDLTPKPVIIRKSYVNVGMKIPPSHQDFPDSEPEPEPLRVRPLRHVHSRSPSGSLDGREVTPDYETSGTKVYIKRRRQSKALDDESKPLKDARRSESSLTAPSSIERPSSATNITTPYGSPEKEPIKRPTSAPRPVIEKARGTSAGERPKSARQSRENGKTHRIPSGDAKRATGNSSGDDGGVGTSRSAEAFAKKITEHVKKPSGSPATPAPPKVHGTRIEGWLATMPDPFVQGRRSSMTPEPLEIKKKPSRRDVETDSEYTEDTRPSGHRKSSPRYSRNHQDEDKAPTSSVRYDQQVRAPSTPTTLKRRGARHGSVSPVKGRPGRATTLGNEALMSGALPDPPQSRIRKPSASKPPERFRIPSGGRPLCAIPSLGSIEPLRPHHRSGNDRARDTDSIVDGSILSRASDGDSPQRNKSGLKRRTTKHSDMISTRSLSKDDSHTIVSSRSIRASRRRAEALTVGQVMNELSTDELKYQRELRTLVDGVVPVLLQHAVSGSKASPNSRVFSGSTNDTKPIVDMGVALERLKTTHKWIPMHEPGELLTWAEGAAKVYTDYLRAWRLGYKDIIVSLAPAEGDAKKNGSPAWGDGLPRNAAGDLLHNSGERVDVAYLLKRPLVRLKYLSKTLASINDLQPSARAEDMAATFQDLIATAKQRVNDEHARLEDEAASKIDATRARDPRSLAPISGVTIDSTRSVRARDYFDMDLMHSSGQQLGCKTELIYRDDATSRGNAGDVLFCEVSAAGRWLLFPPLPSSLVTARKGDRPGELVVMIRGFLSNAQQWREVMSFHTNEEHTSLDWLQILGSSPTPPRLSKKSSFNMLNEPRSLTTARMDPANASDHYNKHWIAPIREVEVPIGERAKSTSQIWDGSEVNGSFNEPEPDSQRRQKPQRYRNTVSSAEAESAHRRYKDDSGQPAYFYDMPKRDRKQQIPNHSRSQSDWTGSSLTTTSQAYSVWMPSTDSRLSDESSGEEHDRPARQPSSRPKLHTRTSSTPSMDMPTIPKLRQSTQAVRTPARPDSPSSDRDLLPSQKRAATEKAAQTPASAPSKLQKRRLSQSERPDNNGSRAPLPPPLQMEPTSRGLKSKILPSLTPAFLKKSSRPSSPLKHEYEPSTASDSLSDSELSDFSDDVSHSSESTVEEMPEEVISTIGDLKAFQDYAKRGVRHSSPPASQPTLPGNSLAPSESASQAPYRTVPPTTRAPAKTVANIFTWAERGSWDSLHPQECQIFVTPGLIEAFDLAQANSVTLDAEGEGSTPSAKGVKPLVALELTPLVPLRRGTAVDISIRSPPTPHSLIRTGNHIMFRSRSPEECEKLYGLINRARIDNPTYIALQHARGPTQQSNWAEIMDKRNAARTSSGGSRSWWNLGSRRSGSYRSKGSRTLSIAATESSVGTTNSAFSALRRFSGSSRIFNIAKSTITSREGTRSTNSESLSSGIMSPAPFDPRMGTPIGITNAKVRLHIREGPSKWRDMGAARLTVMLPPREHPTLAANPETTGLHKRILVYGKSKSELLLDVTLGESAFERIARTGIAVSVYEEADHVSAEGGVLVAKTTVYMIQMKSERDAAYTFGLIGKLRY